MDQNTPRDDTPGAQPPADAGGTDASAWNQAPGPGQPSAADGSGQGASAEQAAWSADTTYQQQQQAQPAPAQDAQQQYAQPQQAYDPAAYAQQYQQPQYQQPQPQYYDPAAYGQQPQYQQPQYYDPAAYGQQPQQPQYQQPQYYDPAAYGQQPGYYDPAAYGQQPQYQQGAYPQQPGQPYAYAQPGQESWQGQPDTYEQGGRRYGRSFIAVLAGWVMLTWGLVFGITGALVLWMNSVTDLIPADITLSQDVLDLAAKADDQIAAVGSIALIIGIIQVIGAVGIWAHRRWGRAFGIVIGLIGVLAALGIITVSAGFEAMNVGLDEAIKGEEGSLAASVLVLGSYLLIFLAMYVGRRQFRRKGVED
jgi:hypothetical protein